MTATRLYQILLALAGAVETRRVAPEAVRAVQEQHMQVGVQVQGQAEAPDRRAA